MFADTITFTDIHGTDDYVLNRVNQDKYSSEYLLVTDTRRVTLKIRNSSFFQKARGVQMDQHNVELTEEIYPVTPGLPSTLRKAFFTFQVQTGDVLASSKEVAIALASWLTASSAAALTKLVNFES